MVQVFHTLGSMVNMLFSVGHALFLQVFTAMVQRQCLPYVLFCLRVSAWVDELESAWVDELLIEEDRHYIFLQTVL